MAERASRGGLAVRGWLVVAVVVLAVLATALVLKLQVPLYTASITVAPAS